MRIIRQKRAAMLVDAILAIYLLAVAALVFSATIGTAVAARGMADQRTKATCIASRELEAIKSLGYSNLNLASLQFYQLADSNCSTSPYTFTNCGTASDNVSAMLPNGKGSITISDYTSTVKTVTVTVSWTSRGGLTTKVSVSTDIGKMN